ncbi:matrix metalloproteinase-9-like [Pitangus sulphuratus]|nr:matrix metalloproteinase-9-like [Pitangus sulphuratus]
MALLLLAPLAVGLLAVSCCAAPLQGKPQAVVTFPGDLVSTLPDLQLAERYLLQFGYTTEAEAKTGSRQVSLGKALRKMQKQLGLEETGELDAATLEAMRAPRCGVPDVGTFLTFEGDLKWDHMDLTYRVINYSPDLDRAVIDDAFRRAFQVWSDVTPLTFTQIYSGEADIMIMFGSQGRGSGPKPTAPAPTEEPQPLPTQEPQPVPTEEPQPLPTEAGSTSTTEEEEEETPEPTAGPIPVDPSRDACMERNFDAITEINGELYFFKDGKYWTHSSFWKSGIQGAFSVADTWPGLPATIDAVFQDLLTKRVFFFAGRQFWVFSGKSVLGPRGIEKLGIGKEAGRISGALQRGRGKVLLFSGENYWRLDVKVQRVDKGYPRAIDDVFTGVPLDSHNVFLYQDKYHFCRGDFYWRMTPRYQVDRVGYIKYDILQCPQH